MTERTSVRPEKTIIPSRLLFRKSRKNAEQEEKMRQERIANANIVLEWMGVREAVYSKVLSEKYPDLDFQFGYARGENGSMLPAVQIRWEQESRKIHSDEHPISRVVKIECDTQNDSLNIYYSSEEEIENELGDTKKTTGWKMFGGDLPGYHIEDGKVEESVEDHGEGKEKELEKNYLIAIIAGAMEAANGKMFDMDESSTRYGRIV